MTKGQLSNELKRVLSQNTLLQSQVAALEKKLAASESKRQDASASLLASQAKVRESNKALSKAESVVTSQAKEISVAEEDAQMIVNEKMEELKRKHQVCILFVNCFIVFHISYTLFLLSSLF